MASSNLDRGQVKTHRRCERPRPGLKGTWVKGGGSAGQDRQHRRHCAAGLSNKRRISTRPGQIASRLASSKSANPATPPALRARSFGLRTHTSQRQFTGRLTSLQILFLVLLFDLTYKPPVSFACIDCRSCCLSFVSRTSPFDRVSAARELRFPQMDQLDIRQSRN